MLQSPGFSAILSPPVKRIALAVTGNAGKTKIKEVHVSCVLLSWSFLLHGDFPHAIKSLPGRMRTVADNEDVAAGNAFGDSENAQSEESEECIR